MRPKHKAKMRPSASLACVSVLPRQCWDDPIQACADAVGQLLTSRYQQRGRHSLEATEAPEVTSQYRINRIADNSNMQNSAQQSCRSRPGPKSGVRLWLRDFVLMTFLARPYGARVPTQTAWVGGSAHRHHIDSYQGLQPIRQALLQEGMQACSDRIRKAEADNMSPNDSHNQGRKPEIGARRQTSSKGLHVFCYNVGGLGGGMCDELLHFLDNYTHYTVALLQEAKWCHKSDYETVNWFFSRDRWVQTKTCWGHDMGP